jgi:hypothetical protein
VLAGEKELSQRFADYTDEVLLQILTTDRAQYRPDALELAGRELTHRGLSLPLTTFTVAPSPPPVQATPQVAQARKRPKSPYQFIDLLFDAALCVFAIWAVVKLVEWTDALGEVWSHFVFWAAFFGLISSMSSLRKRWRTREWWD